MADYFKMSDAELIKERDELRVQYQHYKNMALNLDMSRGKPCTEQLDLSMEMLKMNDYIGENGFDARNYGLLEGMPEARRFFAELLGVQAENVIVCGNSSLQMMYYLIDLGWRQGFVDSQRPWRHYNSIKFLCPVPGYDRHFRVTEYFGFQMISIPMTENGPDMDMVEEMVAKDDSIKGIWCVPVYSNPDGYIYSDETVRRLAEMKTAAPDFKIIWDDAYCVHHLTDEIIEIPNILTECKKAGNSERPLIFCSTSKITYPGAGVAAVAASKRNIQHIVTNMHPMIISFDKLNQLRHVRFFKNRAGVEAHMLKHRALLKPRFDAVIETLHKELDGTGVAVWTEPKGGYFISVDVMDGCAARVIELCKEAGVTLTGAGCAYPYHKDPRDRNIRIAPSYPTVEELKQAAEIFTVCCRLAAAEKLLAAN